MASPVSRLRWWFALGTILMVATVAGIYFYAQWSLRKAVHTIPAKLGLNIQQTAEGFSISKSVEGRTQFTVSASKAVQFKEGGRAELHNVKIIAYGKDASRFDRITGDDFEYDPASGNVNAKGTVLIDLEANPEGMRHADQSPPERTKEPIHLETNGLVFNKNTGDASATGKVVFRTPQASGSAVGVEYVAKTGTMNLLSAVVMTVNRPQPVHLNADHGVITKQPHQVFLTAVHMSREQQEAWSDQATFFLHEDNTVDHILAEGDVRSEIHGRSETHERSDRAELFLTGTRNLLTTAILTGSVQITNQRTQNQRTQNQGTQNQGTQPAEAAAGRVTLHFAGQQILETVHAEDGVRLSQMNSQSGTLVVVATPGSSSGLAPSQPKGAAQSQDIEMTAPVMDFIVKNGRLLERAETSGPPQIVITQPGANQKTVVTAAKFTARFTEQNRISTLHGEPDAKIVSSMLDASKADATKAGSGKAGASGQTDRVSTSQMLDVVFLPEGGVRSITQTGGLVYVDGTQKAWAQRGEYTAADQLVVLSGSPRVVDGGMTTTAQKIRMNRATGDAIAEGNVKSTYSDLKAQPDGGMLASSDPIHVTSRSMTAHRSPAIAVYTGDARLWQDANIVEAPTLQFDRDHRTIFAQGEISVATGLRPVQAGQSPAPTQALAQPVSTVLVQVDKTGKVTPVHITSARLNYADVERRIFLDGGVTAKTSDATMTGERMTVFLLPRSQSQAGANPAMPGQVDRIIAEERVVITQPTRHATGDRLVYTSADDKFVLTGGPPSIFDAEQGKTTGDSLTFYRHDDRVLVEGRGTSPAVTRTQVAR
ncbi:MAG TPA: LPS export ABC transporter periplasmic protein LptC [Terriglobales bacterium]|jgi:lipopolysaccharide export system protein LptA|nr:LPS export ABC transporter periplasmic protein LptC [Terriglobales bacterium]